MTRINDDAVSPAIAFIIAAALFAGTFFLIIDHSVERNQDTGEDVDEASFFSQASALSDVVLLPGAKWYSGAVCDATGEKITANFNPDAIGTEVAGQTGRFGLGEENCARPGDDVPAIPYLSFDKFSNLYDAEMAADAVNDRVDYEEARESLDLDSKAADFHLRSWPVLASTREILKTGYQDPYMRPLYIGNYEEHFEGGPPPPRLAPHVTGLGKFQDHVIAYVNVTNDGSVPTQFSVDLSLRLKRGSPSTSLHTPRLSFNEIGRVELKILKTQDWEWKKSDEPWIDYTISDRVGAVGAGTINLAGVTMTYGSNRVNHFVEAGAGWYDSTPGTVDVTSFFTAWQGDGDPATANDWTYHLKRPDATTLDTYEVPNGETGDRLSTASVTGAHVAELRSDGAGTTLWNWDNLNVWPGDIDQYSPYVPGNYVPSEATIVESAFIDRLVELFDRKVFDPDYDAPDPPYSIPYGIEGDIYPADKHLMMDWIEDVLTPGGVGSTEFYTTLIIGSDIDQTILNSGMVKNNIEEWVEAGGVLIVFGSDGSKESWLQPIYHATLDSGSTGLYAPDPNHPVLNTPNQLDYCCGNYLQTSEWTIKDLGFTHIVQTSGGNLLSISNPGAIGLGRVALTGWRPSSLTADQDTACADPLSETSTCQGLFLLHNLLTVTYRELYLDYGPPIPPDASNGVKLRLVSVYHPGLEQILPVTMQVFVFEGA